MTEFIVTDPTGKEHIVTAPEGATQDQALEYAKAQFGSTPGGAAFGNPNIMRQGERALRGAFPDPEGVVAKIGGAGVLGGIMGYGAPEILKGLGAVSKISPYTRPLAPFLESAGMTLKTQRGASATAGTISGLASETAGQVAEGVGAGPVTAEVVRFVGAGATPEVFNLAKELLRRYAIVPALSVMSKLRKETAKELLKKLEGGEIKTLSEKESAYLDELVTELRGGAKTDAPLEGVGTRMGEEAQWITQTAEQQSRAAALQAQGVGRITPAADREMADIGGDLRTVITARNKAAMEARAAQYTNTEKQRDAIVQARENSGDFIEKLPEYKALVESLEDRLLRTTKARLKSPTLKVSDPGTEKSLSAVLDAISSRRVMISEEEAVASLAKGFKVVRGTHPATGEPAVYREFPNSFEAIDDVRRRLGEVFRGKPDEGYAAIGAHNAKDLYGKLSDIQKKFAGPAQVKLLDDYAARTEGLQMFGSKTGKRATALDLYNEAEFATDVSTLPKAYFKTRASVQALKELTGNQTLVNKSAMEFANRELAGKDAAGVRAWMSKNSDWLGTETPVVQRMVGSYATKLEGAEVSMRNAQEFATKAAKDASMLTRDVLPAQRAVDLIKSGSDELWAKAGPAIAQSPQAKQQMMGAVRQVLADQATSKGTIDFYARNLRPFLERTNITNKAELDFIAQRLDSIKNLKLPEEQALGLTKRMILQAMGGWSASIASRGGVNVYQWSREKVVPD